MKKQKSRKLRLVRETLVQIAELREVRGGGSNNRICAGYTVQIGPCVPSGHPNNC